MLTPDSPMCPLKINNLNLPLYPYQRAIVEHIAMLENDITDKSHITVLAEIFGSGKTIMSLALICYNKPLSKEIIYSSDLKDKLNMCYILDTRMPVMPITIIISAVSCIGNWIDTITNHTNLRYKKITSVREIEQVNADALSQYDVVLISNTRNTTLKKSLTTVFTDKIGKCLYERYIVDDFATSGEKMRAPLVYAKSVILISSNGLNATTSRIPKDDPHLLNFLSDKYTINVPRSRVVKCVPEFVAAKYDISYKYFVIKYCIYDAHIEMLNAFATSNTMTEELLETLNIKGDIVSYLNKILGKKAEKLAATVKNAQLLNQLPEYLENIPESTQPISNVREIIKAVCKNNDLSLIKSYNDNLIDCADEYLNRRNEKIASICDNLSFVFKRLAEGYCKICRGQLGENSIMHMCCGACTCCICYISNINAKSKNTQCYSCMSYDKQFYRVPANISPANIESIISDIICHTSQPQPVKAASDKIGILKTIINGDNTSQYNPDTSTEDINLLQNGQLINFPLQENRKFVIATMSKSGIKLIKESLTEYNPLVLKGNATQLANIIKEFKTNPARNVLILNNNKHSSGIDLSFATDLIVFSVAKDSSIQTQIYGRLQRPGRTCSATIHIITYSFENAFLV